MSMTDNKRGRPTNTERINKNRDEIAENEATLGAMLKRFTEIERRIDNLQDRWAKTQAAVEASDIKKGRLLKAEEDVKKAIKDLQTDGFTTMEDLDKLRTELNSGLSGSMEHWKKDVAKHDDALEEIAKSLGSTDTIVSLLEVKVDELEKQALNFAPKDDYILLHQNICKIERDFKILRADTDILNTNTGAQQKSVWNWVSKIKSDFEVHTYILIALGVAAAANLAFIAWYFLGR